MKKIYFAFALTMMFSLLNGVAVGQTFNRGQNNPYYRYGNYTPYYGGFNGPGSYYNRGSSAYARGFYYQPFGVYGLPSQGFYPQPYNQPFYRSNFNRWPY